MVGGLVDLAARIGDQRPVLEVLLKVSVVGEQQASAADSRQGEDVVVVGPATPSRPDRLGFRVNDRIPDAPRASG